MKKRTNDFLLNLNEIHLGYCLVNLMVFEELDKIDIRISKRIRKKFISKMLPRQKFSDNEYCEAVIRNLGRQILIHEEIQHEINKLGIIPNACFKTILEYFGKNDLLQVIQK